MMLRLFHAPAAGRGPAPGGTPLAAAACCCWPRATFASAPTGRPRSGSTRTAIGMSLPLVRHGAGPRPFDAPGAAAGHVAGHPLRPPAGAVEVGWLDQVVPARRAGGRGRSARPRRLGQLPARRLRPDQESCCASRCSTGSGAGADKRPVQLPDRQPGLAVTAGGRAQRSASRPRHQVGVLDRGASGRCRASGSARRTHRSRRARAASPVGHGRPTAMGSRSPQAHHHRPGGSRPGPEVKRGWWARRSSM